MQNYIRRQYRKLIKISKMFYFKEKGIKLENKALETT